MRVAARATTTLVCFLALALPAGSSAQTVAVVGGEVRPVSGPTIPDGVVVVRDGRIEAVGSRDGTEVPDDVPVIDAEGLVVTPGLVDARTGLALGPGASGSGDPLLRPTTARAADHLQELEVPGVFGMEARETGPHPWAMEGVTAAYVAPEPRSLVAGFGAVVKIAGDRLGPVVDSAAALHLTLGYALPRRHDAPTTRQGMAALLRQWLQRAGGVRTGETFRLTSPATEIEGLPEGSWRRTPELSDVLEGRRPARIHAYAPDDVLTALRMKTEFGLRAVVEGAYGAHVVADRLAAGGVAVILGPAISGSGRTQRAPDAYARTPEAAGILHRAGVPVALSTDGGGGGRAVTVEAAMARAHGLPPGAALRAVTLEAAGILGVDDRLGSLEPGKDGDLVLWRGDPVGTWGEARTVIVDGEVVFRRGGG